MPLPHLHCLLGDQLLTTFARHSPNFPTPRRALFTTANMIDAIEGRGKLAQAFNCRSCVLLYGSGLTGI